MNNMKNYLRLTWREDWKVLVGLPVALFAVCLVYQLVRCGSTELSGVVPGWYCNPASTDFNYFFGGLMLTVFASLMFSNMNCRQRRLTTLTLPVATGVNYLRGLLFYMLYPIVSMVLAFFLADICRVGIMMMAGWEWCTAPTPLSRLLFFGSYWPVNLSLWAFLLLSQAFFACGSIFFPRHSYLKTLLLGVIFNIVLMFTLGFVEAMRASESVYWRPAGWAICDTVFWLFISGIFVISLALYAVAYVRLKEAEVQNRW